MGYGAGRRRPLTRPSGAEIWLFAAGYFLAYVPYAAGTKALSRGVIPGLPGKVDGLTLLPVSVLASVIGLLLAFTALGWWRHASRWRVGGLDLPRPGLWTGLSGLCTAAVIGTTTLAYTFEGVSILLMMLLMRGGVLVLAPLVDLWSGRRVRWFSGLALLLSLLSLGVTFRSDAGAALSFAAVLDVVVYLLAYLGRLRTMSRLAKTEDSGTRLRYLVEEQLVASPALLLGLALAALLAPGAVGESLRAGFGPFLQTSAWPYALGVGFCSYLTGLFGGLILLSPQENSYCVPVNRASSVLAGLLGAMGLALLGWDRWPARGEWAGAGIMLLALVALSAPTLAARWGRSAPPRA